MPRLTSISTLLTSIIILTSCGFIQKKEERKNQSEKPGLDTALTVEAEDMILRQYQVDSSDSSSFIELSGPDGIAKFNFPLPSGYYAIDVRYLSENIGQNTYVMYIDGNQIVAWLGKDRDDQWHMLSQQRWHFPRSIEINKDDEIRIEGFSENGSLAAFDYIEFTESEPIEYQTTLLDVNRTVSTQDQTSIDYETTGAEMITIYPEEYDGAIRNPLKGFRPANISGGSSFIPSEFEHEYGLLIKNYIKWNEIENSASDGVDKITEVCDRKWKGIEDRNIKIIPRVYLAWPGREGGWPADMTDGDFTSEQFKQRVLALIEKLGKAWDNDSRVAYIEMGLIGEWGEMEFPDTKEEIKEAMAAQFDASFKNKLVMIRWPNTYNDHLYNFGYYWDSFAHHDQDYCGFHIRKTSPKWKTAVIGGETAYNWGNVQIQPGQNPEVSLSEPVHREYIIDEVRKLHANHLGWIANYDHSNERVREGAELLQKVMGYRFVISEVTFPERLDTDSKFPVLFKVKNTGSSPFYYNWPVEVSLLDPETKQPVWKEQYSNVDIRTWMPGEEWDSDTDSYNVPAKEYTVAQKFDVPDIPAGEYILALSILDPAGNRPGVRFAIRNYFKGGRHPVGRIGINQSIDSHEISGFDDIYSDRSLSYDRVID